MAQPSPRMTQSAEVPRTGCEHAVALEGRLEGLVDRGRSATSESISTLRQKPRMLMRREGSWPLVAATCIPARGVSHHPAETSPDLFRYQQLADSSAVSSLTERPAGAHDLWLREGLYAEGFIRVAKSDVLPGTARAGPLLLPAGQPMALNT